MILGIGNDIIDIRRIERTLERYGERFLDRVYTDIERHKSDRRNHGRPATPSVSPPRKPVPKLWARGYRGCLLARHGRGQSARRPADHELTGGARERLERDHATRHEAVIYLP